MDLSLSLAAVVTVASALAVVRARRPTAARVALGIHGLSLALLLAILSMPLLAAMAVVLGVGMTLVYLLTHREAVFDEVPFTIWPLAREFGLLCLVLLFWWWLRRPTFVEGLVEGKASARAGAKEVLVLLYTRYAGGLLGVGLTLLAAVIGVGRRGRNR